MLAGPTALEKWGLTAFHWGRGLWGHARHALEWLSAHTGIPIVVVAGVVLVVSWRLAKKSARLLLEVAVATALIFLATKLGWIRW